MEDNDKEDNNQKDISALGLDRDLEFLRGHQGHQEHQPHEDDSYYEDNHQTEYNDKDGKNNKDNNDMGISALALDRDLGFSRTLGLVPVRGISVLGIDRDLWFSGEHQGHCIAILGRLSHSCADLRNLKKTERSEAKRAK